MSDNLIKSFLDSGNWISVNKTVIQKIGLLEAVMLGDLISKYNYFAKKNMLTDDDEFFNTNDNIYNDTGITKNQVLSVSKCLQDYKILSVIKKGVPAKNYYKLNFDKIEKILSSPVDLSAEKPATTGLENKPLVNGKTGDINKNNNKIKLNKNNIKKSASASTARQVEIKKLKKDTPIGNYVEISISNFKQIKVNEKCINYLNSIIEEIIAHPSYKNMKKKRFTKKVIYTLDSQEYLEEHLIKINTSQLQKEYFEFFMQNYYLKQMYQFTVKYFVSNDDWWLMNVKKNHSSKKNNEIESGDKMELYCSYMSYNIMNKWEVNQIDLEKWKTKDDKIYQVCLILNNFDYLKYGENNIGFKFTEKMEKIYRQFKNQFNKVDKKTAIDFILGGKNDY